MVGVLIFGVIVLIREKRNYCPTATFFSLQIPHGLLWYWTGACALRSRRLAMLTFPLWIFDSFCSMGFELVLFLTIFQVWIPSFAILRISKTKRKRDNGHIETTARRNISNKKERGKMLYLKFLKCNILINFKFTNTKNMCNNIVFKSFHASVNPWRLLVLAETCRARKLVYLVLINGILVVK